MINYSKISSTLVSAFLITVVTLKRRRAMPVMALYEAKRHRCMKVGSAFQRWGKGLIPAFKGDDGPDGILVNEQANSRSVRNSEWKLVKLPDGRL